MREFDEKVHDKILYLVFNIVNIGSTVKVPTLSTKC